MLDRNRRIKEKPQRFQSCPDHFDLIITCEERVYDQVVEGQGNPTAVAFANGYLSADLENRDNSEAESCHIINIDIQDNHEEATIGAFMICDLVAMVSYSLC